MPTPVAPANAVRLEWCVVGIAVALMDFDDDEGSLTRE